MHIIQTPVEHTKLQYKQYWRRELMISDYALLQARNALTINQKKGYTTKTRRPPYNYNEQFSKPGCHPSDEGGMCGWDTFSKLLVLVSQDTHQQTIAFDYPQTTRIVNLRILVTRGLRSPSSNPSVQFIYSPKPHRVTHGEPQYLYLLNQFSGELVVTTWRDPTLIENRNPTSCTILILA